MLLTLLIFLLVLSVLVLVHEAGHYLAARLFGVKADEFGYGIPPRIIGFVKVGKKWKKVDRKDRKEYENTIWSLNWLPIGGFVRIKGEQGDGEFDADSFHVKPIWQRIVILAAGVGMNWILAAVLLSVGLMIGVPSTLDELPPGATVEKQEVSIIETLKDSPAEKAGVKAGDVIVRIGADDAKSLQEARDLIAAQDLRPFTLLVRRDGQDVAVDVTPVYLEQAKRTGIGVGLVDTGIVRFPPLLAVKNGVILTGTYTKAVVLSFLDLFRDLVKGGGETADQVSGPVGIAVITGRIAKQGIMPLVHFAAILSINLAVVNFLPIPALDGGRALFLVVEGLRRKAIRRTTEALIHNISFLILIALILLVTLRDLGRYGGAIVGGLKGLVGM
ncbi:MAG TPA: M50 family metallopeptidase [Candidatus Methylomirabilis sp.]|nr:M50 family metallopeptidase [Candidatus Methylomirabilis sp.]